MTIETIKDLLNEIQTSGEFSVQRFVYQTSDKNDDGVGFRFEAVVKLYTALYRPNVIGVPPTAFYTTRNFSKGEIDETCTDDSSKILTSKIRTNGDKSDITFVDVSNKTIHVISCKIGKHEKDYDLTYIDTIFNKKYKSQGWKLQAYLAVPDKDDVKTKNDRRKRGSEVVKDLVNEATLIDFHNLQQLHLLFLSEKRKVKSLFRRNDKPIQLYPHQIYLNLRLLSLLEKGSRRVLFNCSPRSGKTYITGKAISTLFEQKKVGSVLFISTTPKEQEQAVKKLQEYSEFSEDRVQVVFLNSSHTTKRPVVKKDLPVIYVASEQFLRSKTGKKCRKKSCKEECSCLCSSCNNTGEECECARFQKVEWLADNRVDMCVFDETHFAGTTTLAKEAIKTYSEGSIQIFLTGTAKKVIHSYRFCQDEIINWRVSDFEALKCFTNEETRKMMKTTHGSLFEKTLCSPGVSFEQMEKVYNDNFPSMKQVYLNLTKDTFDKIQKFYEKHAGSMRGWSPKGLMLLCERDKKSDRDRFQDEENLEVYLRMIFGEWDTDGDSWYRRENDTSLMGVIEPELNRQRPAKEPVIILSTLPVNVDGQTLKRTSDAVIKFMEDRDIFPTADFVSVNGESNGSASPVELVEKAHKEAKRNGKKYLVVFIGYQLNMSVTFEKCDVVIRMDHFEEEDRNQQINARCLTGDSKGRPVPKKYGWVIDANISRICKTILYNAINHPDNASKNLRDSLTYYLRSCQFSNVKFDNVAVDLILSEAINSPTKVFDRLKQMDFAITDDDYKKYSASFGQNRRSSKKSPVKPGIEVVDDTDSSSDTSSSSNKKKDKEKDKEKEKLFQLCRDVILYLIPVYTLLGLESEDKSFIGIHHYLQESEFISYLEQLFSMWKWVDREDETVFEMIENIYNKYLYNSSEFKYHFDILMFSLSNPEDRESLREWIDKHFLVHDNEKVNNGEVSTPSELRQSMLSKVPVDFWKSPKRVLEPCCGKGGFLVDIVDLFMKNLPIRDEKERYRVIVEECLYFGDINSINMYISRLLLDPRGDYKLNEYTGDTLENDWDEKFDLVVCNPPYNASGTLNSGNTLWHKFVEKAMSEWAIPQGYLLFVHPPGWRKPNTVKSKFGGLFTKMAHDNHLLYLEIHDSKDGMKTFNCGTRYDWYLLRCSPKEKSRVCKVVDMYGKTTIIDMRDWEWLPNGMFKEISPLLAGDDEEKCPVVFSGSAYEPRKKWMSSKSSHEFKYKCVHSTPKDGTRYMWSKVNDRGHFGVPKVIFGESGISHVVVDMNGDYGITHAAMGIEVSSEEEALSISEFLTSSRFKKIIASCTWSSFRIDWNLFTFFKKNFWEVPSPVELVFVD